MDIATDSQTIGFPHRAQAFGGPGSFQTRLIKGLKARGCRIVYPDSKTTPTVILVVGGTVRLDWLIWCRSKGARIIHRLDGINWRYKVVSCSPWYKLRSEARNGLTRTIRRKIAGEIIYQSEFVREWWRRVYGEDWVPNHVIYNAVDLNEFFPAAKKSMSPPMVICAESNLNNDPVSLRVLSYVANKLISKRVISGIRIIGVLGALEKNELARCPGIELSGAVLRDQMPDQFREGNIFLNLDINAACPNAVIEALASGLPVVGFSTGSLEELVSPRAGRLVPYGGNPWRLEDPDFLALCDGIEEVAANISQFSSAARRTAEERFSLTHMVDTYIDILLGAHP